MNWARVRHIGVIFGILFGLSILFYGIWFLTKVFLLFFVRDWFGLHGEEFDVVTHLTAVKILYPLGSWLLTLFYYLILFSLAALWIWLRPQDLELAERAVCVVLRFVGRLFNCLVQSCSPGIKSIKKAWKE